MNDFDFDNAFADDLGKERNFEPADQNWAKIEADLAAIKLRERRRRRLLWGGSTIAALLLIGFGYGRLWMKSVAMEKEIAALQQQLADHQHTQAQADTTVQHLIVVQYDTVYRTLIVQQRSQTQPVNGTFSSQGMTLSNGKGIEQAAKNLTAPPTQNASTTPSNQTLTAQGANHAVSTPTALLNTDAATLPAPTETVTAGTAPQKLPQSAPKTNELEGKTALSPAELVAQRSAETANWRLSPLPPRSLPNLFIRPKKIYPADTFGMAANAALKQMPLIKPVNTKRFAVGLLGGGVFVDGSGISDGYGATWGLAGRMNMGKHWGLIGEARGTYLDFEVRPSQADLFQIPPINPPNVGDVLKSTRVGQYAANWSLGARYALFPEKRLNPFVSLAWVGSKSMHETLFYDFRNGISMDRTVVRNEKRGPATYKHGGQLGLGAEWRFAPRFSAALETTWSGVRHGHHQMHGWEYRMITKGSVFYLF